MGSLATGDVPFFHFFHNGSYVRCWLSRSILYMGVYKTYDFHAYCLDAGDWLMWTLFAVVFLQVLLLALVTAWYVSAIRTVQSIHTTFRLSGKASSRKSLLSVLQFHLCIFVYSESQRAVVEFCLIRCQDRWSHMVTLLVGQQFSSSLWCTICMCNVYVML